MNILSLEQLLEIHALIVESTGGSVGLRDLGRLEAAIATQTQNIFGEELHPDTSESGVWNKSLFPSQCKNLHNRLSRSLEQRHASTKKLYE